MSNDWAEKIAERHTETYDDREGVWLNLSPNQFATALREAHQRGREEGRREAKGELMAALKAMYAHFGDDDIANDGGAFYHPDAVSAMRQARAALAEEGGGE